DRPCPDHPQQESQERTPGPSSSSPHLLLPSAADLHPGRRLLGAYYGRHGCYICDYSKETARGSSGRKGLESVGVHIRGRLGWEDGPPMPCQKRSPDPRKRSG